MTHPLQPLVRDSGGVIRFKENPLVRYLLNWASPRGCSMNDLAILPGISDEDRRQFAQLIGYSVGGYGDLSYVSEEDYERAANQEVLE